MQVNASSLCICAFFLLTFASLWNLKFEATLLSPTAADIAETLVWVASRPPHVNIDEMLIKPVDQAAMHKIYRRKN